MPFRIRATTPLKPTKSSASRRTSAITASVLQILLDLGIRKLRIMTNNPRKIVGLEGYGIEIVGREPIEVGCCATNEEYMRTKQEKMGHMLHVSGDRK